MDFGTWVEAELDKVEGKNSKDTARKRTARLKVLLGEKPKFADPALKLRRG